VTITRYDRRFATTRWTLVAAAGGDAGDAAAALNDLCEIYWPPLYAYLRGRGYDADRAQDLTQGFFARLLEKDGLRTADAARGRLRGFLLVALQRHVINEHAREVAIRRGGPELARAARFDDVERAYVRERHADDTPDRIFDRKWAGIVLDRAMARLREECTEAGRAAIAETLLPYLSDVGELPSYRDAAAKLSMSEGAVKVAVHRLRQRFGAILRLEIGETVLSPEAVDDELRELLRAVAS
jgi:RNA polymerase sigma-70 factor (ECF subfamily)